MSASAKTQGRTIRGGSAGGGLADALARLWPGSAQRLALETENARFAAFLKAVPYEYCGWNERGVQAVSPRFAEVVGLAYVKTPEDLELAFAPGDAAAFRGLFERLTQQGKPFVFSASTVDRRRVLKITGARGTDDPSGELFHVLWVEDISRLAESATQSEYLLLESERREQEIRSALENLPVPVWLRNENLDITWCNRAYAALFSETPAAVVAEQKEISARALAQKAWAAQGSQTESRHLVAGGARRLLEISETPLPGEGLVLGSALDITRVEEGQSEIRRIVEANTEVLEHLRTAIITFSADTRVEFFNAAYAALWGLDEKWLNDRPRLFEVMDKLRALRRLPEQADFRQFRDAWQARFTALIEPHEEMQYLPDGTVLRMVVMPRPAGGLLLTFEDVTSRMQLETSYNTLVAVQQETLDNLAEGLAVYGGDGRLRLWNPAFARLWKLQPEELEGNPHVTQLADRMLRLFPRADIAQAREALLQHAFVQKDVKSRILRVDGTAVEHAAVPLPDGNVLNTYVDITDTVNVEKALLEKNAALEEAERLKLDFLANVSYQLRTPLNVIIGFAEVLNDQFFGPLNEKQVEYTQGMISAGQRLVSLINDILDLSTIEAGYLTLSIDRIDVAAMLESVRSLTQEWVQKQSLKLEVSYQKSVGVIAADERRLKQVLLNLISNAISFTDPGGLITLGAERLEDRLRLTVTDSGVGIPQEDLDRVFKPFERAQTRPAAAGAGERKRSGAGLGLTLVQKIIGLHGGTVSIESVPGKGTRITCDLPLDASAQKAQAGQEQ